MKRIGTAALILVIFGIATATALPLEPGTWMQTSSTAGDCADCGLEVSAPTTHLRSVHASNGWIAYLRYIPDEDVYEGFMELTDPADPDYPDWRGVVFAVTATVDSSAAQSQTLTIEAEGSGIAFRATYRMTE